MLKPFSQSEQFKIRAENMRATASNIEDAGPVRGIAVLYEGSTSTFFRETVSKKTFQNVVDLMRTEALQHADEIEAQITPELIKQDSDNAAAWKSIKKQYGIIDDSNITEIDEDGVATCNDGSKVKLQLQN